MSDLVQSATFARVFQQAKAAGDEGLVAIAAISSPTSLTKGKEYRILIDKADDTMWFEDDSSVPVYLVFPEDLTRFESLVDVSDLITKIGSAEGLFTTRVEHLIRELQKVPTEPTTIQVDDVIVVEENSHDKPYIVAKLLSRDEIRYVGRVAETLVGHDLLVYHLHGETLTVSIVPSHKARKVTSLKELGHEPLAPSLVEKLTVFDANA